MDAQQQFTVIAVWDSTGEVFTYTYLAGDAHEAMALAANANNNSDDLQILGAIPGEHDITAACEDAGKAAYASDLGEPQGDDLCDVCCSSGVEVDHTHDNGDTVCTKCAEQCEHSAEDGDDEIELTDQTTAANLAAIAKARPS